MNKTRAINSPILSYLVQSQKKLEKYSRAPKTERSDFGALRNPNFLGFQFQTVWISDVPALIIWLKWFGFQTLPEIGTLLFRFQILSEIRH